MRGVVVFLFIIFAVMLTFFVGVAVLEPVGEHVKTYDSINDGELDGDSVVDRVWTAVFQWMPIVTLGGMALWALRWYMRKERVVGRR